MSYAVKLGLLASLLGAPAVAAPAPPQADPAAIMVTAGHAKVFTRDGKTFLVMEKTASVVTAVAALHAKRRFESFPLRELPVSWNSCNVMKDQNRWWNEDGYNAVFQFDSGAAKHPDNAHFAGSRLLTAPITEEKTMLGDGGSAKLKLLNASLEEDRLQFEVAGGKLTPGAYQGVGLLAECILTP